MTSKKGRNVVYCRHRIWRKLIYTVINAFLKLNSIGDSRKSTAPSTGCYASENMHNVAKEKHIESRRRCGIAAAQRKAWRCYDVMADNIIDICDRAKQIYELSRARYNSKFGMKYFNVESKRRRAMKWLVGEMPRPIYSFYCI